MLDVSCFEKSVCANQYFDVQVADGGLVVEHKGEIKQENVAKFGLYLVMANGREIYLSAVSYRSTGIHIDQT